MPITFFMNDFFRNKVVAITGGSEGIGKALIDKLIPMGAKVATCGRNQDKLYNLQVQYSNHLLHTMVADVSDYAECENFINSTIDTFGGIDILINNAGVSMRALVKDVNLDVVKKIIDTNFYGTVYCTKLALNSIIERSGTIVGISSVAGYRGLPGRSGYSASKFAVIGWLESLRIEMADSGVNIMWACPGFTRSNLRNAALDSKGKIHGESLMNETILMQPDVCAHRILRAISKHKRSLVLTFRGRQIVFLNKIFPLLADRIIKKIFMSDGLLTK